MTSFQTRANGSVNAARIRLESPQNVTQYICIEQRQYNNSYLV